VGRHPKASSRRVARAAGHARVRARLRGQHLVRPRRHRRHAPDVVARLNREINGALADATIKGRLKALGATVMPGTPAEFGKLIAEETEKWAAVVKRSGAKPD
jgi:hypothetical protein